jgi:putative ABC transport system permease protein
VAVDVVAFRRENATPEALISELKPQLEACLGSAVPIRIETLTAPIERSESLLAAYRFNILIMSAITVLVCGLLVSQATRLSLPGIVRELSILRTLGISRRQCFVAVVVEAATVSCAGALTGYTVGYPIVIWLTGFLLKTAAEIYHLDLSALDPSAVVVQGVAVVAGMTVLGSVSAAIGAREVLTLAPYRGTRREQIHNVPLSERVAFRNAAIATAVGALCILALSVFQTTVLAYASIIVMLIWAGYTAPLVLCIMTHFLALFPAVIPLRLARASLRSSGRQFILTVVAGCIAISLMTSLSIMVSSFRGTLEQWSALRLSGDLFVSSAVEGIGNEGRIALPYWRSLQAAPGIRAIIPYFETVSSIAGRDVVVGGVDVNVQCARKVYPIVAGGCDVPTPHGTSRALISESASRKLGFGVADSFELNGRRFMAAGVVQEFGTEQPLVILDQADFLARYPGHQPKSLTIDLIDSRQLEVVRSALEAVAPHELVVRDHGQLMKLVRDIFNRTFRVTDSIRWMVFIIAMLGIVSTAIQHLWERRREFKTALIMGVSRTSLATSLAVESLGCALVALILGLVAGTLIGWCLTAYVNPLVFGWSLRFSPGIGPLLEALFFVVVIAGIGFFGAYFSLQIIAQRVRMADE